MTLCDIFLRNPFLCVKNLQQCRKRYIVRPMIQYDCKHKQSYFFKEKNNYARKNQCIKSDLLC